MTSMDTDQPTCKDCKFFDADAHLCRINPPVITAILETAWPVVNPVNDWCGQFEPSDAYVKAQLGANPPKIKPNRAIQGERYVG